MPAMILLAVGVAERLVVGFQFGRAVRTLYVLRKRETFPFLFVGHYVVFLGGFSQRISWYVMVCTGSTPTDSTQGLESYIEER